MTITSTPERVLIAIGGNALYDKADGNTLNAKAIQDVCQNVAHVVKHGYLPVITFGNGPQVGILLDMAETAVKAPSNRITLDTCVSWTQGEIGFWLAKELTGQLARVGLEYTVVAINTTVVVDPNDPAFKNPTKPVGKFISAEVAQQLFEERGWIVGPDANRGYRRLVPSPKPLQIIEQDAVEKLLAQGIIPLCCGGGGIPVFKTPEGLQGIEAVIDKDYTSCLLAKNLKIENLIICTEVEHVCLNFGQPNEEKLGQLSMADAKRYMAEGHFAAGSMGPKIAAMIDYLEGGGNRAFITSIPKMTEALAGVTGTEIYRAQQPAQTC